MNYMHTNYFGENRERIMLLYIGSLYFDGATYEERRLVRSMMHYSLGMQGRKEIDSNAGKKFIQQGASCNANLNYFYENPNF